MQTHQYDIVIIGGGPAGMTAAIYAARAQLTCIILESNITGGLVNATYEVENFPSWPRVHGMELMEKMRGHVDGLGVAVEEVCEIERLELSGKEKRVYADTGIYAARAVILATGRTPVPLDVPTECEQVHYCAICDGNAYKGKRVMIAGGGNSAFDEGLYLQQLGVAHITLVESMPRYFAAQSTQDAFFASGKVTGHRSTNIVDLELADGRLVAVLLENTETGERFREPVEGLFVFMGQKPNSALFAETVALNAQGYIKSDAEMKTNIPGVFSAGDINEKPFRQIVTAVSDGAVAALSAERYLRLHEGP